MVYSEPAVINDLKLRFFDLITHSIFVDDSEINNELEVKCLANDKESDFISSLWQNLSKHYNEPHRYYHTLTHIHHLLRQLDNYQHLLIDSTLVELAIWYHDIIYDPKQSDNEQQSATYFKQAMQNKMLETDIDKVVDLIVMTAKHQIFEQDKLLSNKQDAKYFLDMDLSILGADWAIYKAYSEQVVLEYTHLSDMDVNQGRKAVLKTFLTRPRLYFTDEFYQLYEDQARENIATEISLLS